MTTPPPIPDRFSVRAALAATPLERSFAAFDALLQREVVLKMPGTGAVAAWSASQREALLREARALAKVKHAAIATILHVEETAEGPLLVLEPEGGETLAARLRQGPLDVPETLAVGRAVASALAAVHYAGIVHRAVGPNAIRLHPDGRVELAAFTFAKTAGLDQRSSLAHGSRGEPEVARWLPDYSAPEQNAGQPAEPRSDLFALGCTLFRCLAGRDAFAEGAPNEPPPDLRRLVPGVPKELAEAVRKCLAHAKTARFATAQDVLAALDAVPAGRAATGSRRGLVLAGLGAAALAVAVAVMVWSKAPAGPVDRGADTGTDAAAPEDARYQRTYGPDYRRLFGLFIGIGQGYAGTDWPPLQNPVREVEAVAAQLRANDAQWAAAGAITVLPDGEARFARIEEQLERIAREAEAEDAVLFYFAGHGMRDGRSFGLCAQDVRGPIQNGTGYLRRDVLVSWLDLLKAKHVLVVLDCCHSGAVFDAEAGPSRGRDPYAGRDLAPGAHHRRNFSREFLCSTAASEKASDGALMSPFCAELLAQLRQPAGVERQFVAARFLAAHIGEAMDQNVARAGRVQVPKFRQMAEQEGSFVFKLRKGQ